MNDLMLDPAIIALLAPVVTALVKYLAGLLNTKLPDWLKGAITGGAGVSIAMIAGGIPVDGLAGAFAGTKLRDQLFGKAPTTPDAPAVIPPRSGPAVPTRR